MKSLTGKNVSLIGMVHVAALPGTPRNSLPPRRIVDQATQDAWRLAEAGFDAILIENMHDLPYLKANVGPEIVAMMTRVGVAVREAAELPLGVQVLAGANEEALAVAQAAEASFVRVEGFVYGHVADEGWIDGCAGSLLRYRRQIGAEDIQILADIKKKHSSHAVTADVGLVETAEAADFFGADGVIVSGTATGKAVRVGDLKTVSRGCGVPVLVGSGATPKNLKAMWPSIQGVIVGSWNKTDGIWSNSVEPGRANEFVKKAEELRKAHG